eukprot:14017957-Ditylum_brightwellii.AAC.1
MNEAVKEAEKHSAVNGWQDHSYNLWHTRLVDTTPTGNAMLKTMTIGEQMQLLHAAAGSPVPSTWIDAINNGFFVIWPGLMAANVRKYLPKSRATNQGHLEQKDRTLHQQKEKKMKQ